MHEINFVDPSFDLRRSSEYHLSIQLGLDGFSFCIVDKAKNSCVAFRQTPLAVEKPHSLVKKAEEIFQDEKLQNQFASVLVLYSTNSSTIVPTALGELSTADELGAVTDFPSKHDEKMAELLPGFEYQLVYGIPRELAAFLRSRYANLKIQNRSISLISDFNRVRSATKNSLLVHFDKKYILVAGVSGSKLVLFNSYFVKSEYDCLFYTLNAWRILRFDSTNDELFISGMIAEASPFINQIRRYVAQVSFLKPSGGIQCGRLFENIEAHQFVGLLDAYSCES